MKALFDTSTQVAALLKATKGSSRGLAQIIVRQLDWIISKAWLLSLTAMISLGMADANHSPDGKTVTTFDSFEDAKEAQRQLHLAMTPLERLALVEKLRAEHFPYESRPPIQRTVEIIQF